MSERSERRKNYERLFRESRELYTGVDEKLHELGKKYSGTRGELLEKFDQYKKKIESAYKSKEINERQRDRLLAQGAREIGYLPNLRLKIGGGRGKFGMKTSARKGLEGIIHKVAAAVLIFTSVYLFSLEPEITGYSVNSLNNAGNPFSVVAVFLLIGAFVLLIKD